MKFIKHIGLGLFVSALLTFIALIFISQYEITDENLAKWSESFDDKNKSYLVESLSELKDQHFGNKFSYFSALKGAFNKANEAINNDFGVDQASLSAAADAALSQAGSGPITFSEELHTAAKEALPEGLHKTISDYTSWMIGREYADGEALKTAINEQFGVAANAYVSSLQVGNAKEYVFQAAKLTAKGIFWNNKYAFFLFIIVLGSIGALMYIYPAFFDGMPGIKHNGIYFSSAHNRGLIGILTGIFLVGFYILLYFYHQYIAEWITLMDPVAYALRGEAASQWFMYGFLYTIAIVVMGVRMFAKYRHSNYHKLRTASIIFFQMAFAFIIPQILYQLNLPDSDLKNAWPLNYYFFFDWNIDKHISSGTFGIFMFVWGTVLTVIGVPVLTYFFGKRWYCSWVCGCGGLAETLGDPYRQLSDKSLKAWNIERYLIHGVLAFAVVMTGLVLYTYFSGASSIGFLNSFKVREVYGFAIGSIFAGVIGTGFYPFMGNRVWCRFGCPLAAYLGLVQRFKSRFRITTNGGQCISCGNCSTYCEMGIDVRWYAQRGQNIVRSSCVGCGVCAAVCPRGVLALENGPNTDGSRMNEVKY
ncbi:MAG: 4Fe-4S dicluster domain-containing protein [Bacteroidota bacterium]